MKSKKVKHKAVNGLVSGRLRLGRVKRKPLGFFIWGMIGPGRNSFSIKALEQIVNCSGMIDFPPIWDGGGEIKGRCRATVQSEDELRFEMGNVGLTLDFKPFTEERIKNMRDWCEKDFDNIWIKDEDNTFLLRTSTNYTINIRAGYILINNRKYKFEFDHNGTGIDLDGDILQTHMLHNNMVCRFGPRLGDVVYRKIKILGEL